MSKYQKRDVQSFGVQHGGIFLFLFDLDIVPFFIYVHVQKTKAPCREEKTNSSCAGCLNAKVLRNGSRVVFGDSRQLAEGKKPGRGFLTGTMAARVAPRAPEKSQRQHALLSKNTLPSIPTKPWRRSRISSRLCRLTAAISPSSSSRPRRRWCADLALRPSPTLR